MSAVVKFIVGAGRKNTKPSSDILAPKFAAVGIGTIELTDDGQGGLSLNGASLVGGALAEGQISIGNDVGVSVPRSLHGDAEMDFEGLITVGMGAITTAKLADNGVTAAKLNNDVAGVGLSRNGTTKALDVNVDSTTVALNGGVLEVPDSGINTDELADDSVTNPKLSPGLRSVLSDHETRTTDLENEVLQLGQAVEAIQNNFAQQAIFLSTDGQVDFVVTEFDLDPDNSVLDLDVRIDGRLQTQDEAGSSAESFFKVDEFTVRLSEPLPEGKQVVIFKRGTSSGPAITAGSAPASDLTSIVVAPAPAVNGAKALGAPLKAWSGLYIKDTTTSQVYFLHVDNGAITFDPI